MMSRMIGSGLPSPTQPFFVIGRVELAGRVLPLYDETDIVTSHSQHFPLFFGDSAGPRRPSRCVELRAASARIAELFVYEDGIQRVWPTAEVVELLARAYRVPVSAGEPPYSADDWNDKLLPEYRYLQVGLYASSNHVGSRQAVATSFSWPSPKP